MVLPKCELLLPGDTLEHAVLLSVQLKDEKLFERNFLQLRPYYTDTRCARYHGTAIYQSLL